MGEITKKWIESEFASTHRVGFRLLKMVHETDSTVLPMNLLMICVNLAEIYAGLFLTSTLIDNLLDARFRQAALYALLLAVSALILGSIGEVLLKKVRTVQNRFWQIVYLWIAKKAISLDYETMEDPDAVKKLLSAERTCDMYGSVGIVVLNYGELLKALLNIVISVGLSLQLVLKHPTVGGITPLSGREDGIGQAAALLSVPGVSLFLFGTALTGVALLSVRTAHKYAEREKNFFQNRTGTEEKLTYLNDNIFFNYRAGKIIRIFEMQDMLLKNGEREFNKGFRFYLRRIRAKREETMENLANSGLFTVFSYLLVLLKTISGAITVGAFTQYVGALNQFGSACASLIEYNAAIRRNAAYMGEFLAFLDVEEKHSHGTIPLEKRDDGEYELAFENVSFRYPGSAQYVLKNVNCRLDMKRKMAVVGRNGAGKTTFIKLLCGLYEPTEGRITLNGVDIRKYKPDEYRDLFGVVFQDFRLFSFPVWENVAAGYGRNDGRLWKALRQAGAEEMVKNMPEGLETLLYKDTGEGVEISGGEAQKLAIARALYKDGALVVLDEPTAALDPLAEAEVYARFDEMTEGKTSIYISHRMSSCRFCDDIIVFDDGRIEERGSHETLLAAGGLYSQLWNAQAKYYA
ncbi:MAG TPA: ABC transporter ATP-binding protein/permease [Candidatus Eisenbergiella merdipullorum]|uniref:ABC transporter ATP-binding protein/permease n=1 Tax=Candidatus Eisenbergiella merdipullorum TaxID=2838553 RepID=A0A9D2I9L2_9FIRM|nr:ABC transporter ATP-binding protein/permease [Candidatus Eisenbergiella merdipullorum]